MTLPLHELLAEMEATCALEGELAVAYVHYPIEKVHTLLAGYHQLQEENADLRKDIGACHATFAKPINILNDRVDARDADISALKALLREALAALKPFCSFADDVDRYGHEDDSTCLHRVNAGHLRHAHSIAAHIKKGLPDGE